MTRSIRLRPWQKAALDRFLGSSSPDFLAVATPGAGKTTFALTAARHHLAERPGRLVVVAPTAHLKAQWAAAAARFALHLDPSWSATDGALPRDMHGIVTTYQQVATSAPALRSLAAGSFVVLDELHHAADDRAWGDAVRIAFEGADRRLALSGTPFRSDTRAIPFVDYHLDEARPDYEYGYGDALTDRAVVRPVYFPRTNGQMEWSAPDGTVHEASFDDALDAARASQRLRTALSLDGEWLPTVLRSAHTRLMEVRQTHPDAGGLVIAIDQDHARGIAELLRARFGTRATVVTSDDPRASSRIALFAQGRDPWLVAVRMVSEGVDIPRLRVGVFATTTSTELFFRQAVGRLVRWTRGVPQQKAWLFIPDDPRLRRLADGVAEQRRHSLQRRARPDDAFPGEDLDAVPDQVGAEEQMSLFAAISAVATDHVLGAELDDDIDDDPGDGEGFELELAPPPALVGADPAAADGGVGTLTRTQDKKRLRDLNADLAKDLVRSTGWSHAQVNAELNRLSGISRVTEATVTQLRNRLEKGTRWLNRSA
jgi:superfamily II DNA or RNA helicase